MNNTVKKFKMDLIRLCFISMLVLFAPLSIGAEELKQEFLEELVLDTIRKNPEIVLEALSILEQQKNEAQDAARKDILSQQRDILENDPNAPVLGNPNGDVTVVEFFDYNCSYCKKVMPEVKRLIAADKNIRLVYREWPILGEGSVFAAKAALASRAQGKYEEFHWALMEMRNRADEKTVLRIAEKVGLDIEELLKDMEKPIVSEHIAMSMRITQALGFNGTPSFIIGNNLIPGFVEKDALADYVSQARKE
jgi:protein-disulfide isomerase